MKKIVVFFISLYFLCSTSYADTDLTGTWVMERKLSVSEWQISTLHILSDHTAFSTVQNFTKDNPGSTEKQILSWSIQDNKVVFLDNSGDSFDLYIDNQYRVSVDPRCTYGFYYRVPSTANEYEAAISASEPEPINLEPYGKWSYYDGTSDPNNVYVLNDTGIISFELYLFADGNAYFDNAYLEKGKTDLRFDHVSGIWIGDHNDMTLRLGNQTFKALITDDGLLHFRFPSGATYTMVRIEKGDVTR